MQKNTENINQIFLKTKNYNINCAICRSKKSIFIRKQEASGMLSNLGLKAPLS